MVLNYTQLTDKSTGYGEMPDAFEISVFGGVRVGPMGLRGGYCIKKEKAEPDGSASLPSLLAKLYFLNSLIPIIPIRLTPSSSKVAGSGTGLTGGAVLIAPTASISAPAVGPSMLPALKSSVSLT